MPTLLDSCATCSVCPEEVLCLLVEFSSLAVSKGRMEDTDRNFPIVRLERYLSPAKVSGVGTKSAMQSRFAVVLRGEFVSANRVPGDSSNPVVDFYCKVLPRGTTGKYPPADACRQSQPSL